MEIFTNFSHFVGKFVVTKNFVVMAICLRVTCASSLFKAGVEVKLIRDRTGHRSNALFKYEKLVRLSLLRFLRCWRLSAAVAINK